MQPENFGKKVREIRLARGMSQRDLANGAYTKAYISMLENGRTRCSMKAMTHISKRLGVSIPELMGGLPKGAIPNLAAIPTSDLLEEIGRRTFA
jgi:transcriptional regulator with XRE-family HTH domain